ncbi:AtpZ/AtpI family protein [Pseudaminobacter sp. 19-2017]|uniref:ATP synthase protein I n=1 Tax=Pseudaminobacter soli (ex Zhang et al. 2022) TaxID=2831468 RepID=A0A942E4F9_9HYPH|nr:AtpZ/AtpI family protein [Pseudaminobacter soli]
MAGGEKPDETGRTGPGARDRQSAADQDLDSRRQRLGASLAARGHGPSQERTEARTSSVAGYGQALKLSSEFIAGVAVGAGLGWFIDRLAGTSPWGLIVFLLLGFAAGVLNVMRSAGLIAEAGAKAPKAPENGGRN